MRASRPGRPGRAAPLQCPHVHFLRYRSALRDLVDGWGRIDYLQDLHVYEHRCKAKTQGIKSKGLTSDGMEMADRLENSSCFLLNK